jgi:hypothetical protein
MKVLLGLAMLLYLVYRWTGGGYGTDTVFGPPTDLPLSRYAAMPVSVWVSDHHGATVYLGDTVGTSSCGTMAYAEAAARQLRDWSYACCTHEAGSRCYRKIR